MREENAPHRPQSKIFYVETEADYFDDRAVGGFIIQPDGQIVAVDHCGHSRTLELLRGERWYADAFTAGYIRVTFCERTIFAAEMYEQHATLDALRALRRLIAAFKEGKGKEKYELDLYDEYFHGLDADTARNHVTRIINEKLAAKVAERKAA